MADGSLIFDTKLDSSGLSSGLGSLGGIAGKALGGLTAAVGAGAAAFGALTKSSLDAVSNMEQNVGGVQTLFKENADAVIANANEAYKTAGMSANDYMSTVTSFSASLLQGLGGDTKKAGTVANTAIVDMSDNANKMGTDMGLIQNAYQGFAKQNYTMLDNLKLGYGGTASEMARLINDTGVMGKGFTATAKNMSEVPFDKVIEAIHKTQDAMGITGTTAKEAASTIEGSVNSMKSSWDNLLAGSGSADEFADAFQTAASVVVKNLGEIIPRLAETLPKVISAIGEQLPPLVESLLPALVQGGVALLTSFAAAVPSLLGSLMSIVPVLFSSIMQIMTQLADAVTTFDWAGAAQKVVDGINAFINSDGLSKFLTTLTTIITGIAQGLAKALPILLPALVKLVAYIAVTLIQQLPELIKAAFQLILALGEGIVSALPTLGSALLQILQAVWSVIQQIPGLFMDVFGDVLGKLAEWAGAMITNAGTAMSNMLNTVVMWISQLPENIWTWLVNTVTRLMQWGQQMITNASTAMSNMLSTINSWVAQLPGRIWTWLVSAVTKVVAWGQQMISNASSAMSNMLSTVVSWICQLPDRVWTWLSQAAQKVVTWGADLVVKGAAAAKGLFDAIVNGISSLPDKMKEIGSNIVSGIWNGISSGWDWLKDKVSGLANSLFEAAKDVLDIGSPSKVFAKGVGRWIPPGISQGMDKAMPAAIKDMQAQAKSLVAGMQATVSANAGALTLNAQTAAGQKSLGASGTTVYNDNHVEQENTYNTPVATPSEVAKSQREAVRNIVGGVK
jgi:phage-related protein